MELMEEGKHSGKLEISGGHGNAQGSMLWNKLSTYQDD